MTRLIDADALNKKLCETTIFIKGGEIFQRMINDAPTIEPDGDLTSRQDVISEIHKYFVEEIDKTPTEIDEDGDEVYTDMPTVNSLLACNKELSKRIKALPSAESTGAMDEAIQKYIKDGYMQPIGEDLISRQAVLDALEESGYCYHFWVDIENIINSLPSAPDSRQRGEWELDPDGMDWNIPAWRCSECGFVANYIGVEANGFLKNPMNWSGSKYCPECGCKIVGARMTSGKG